LKWDGYDAIAQTRDAQSYLRHQATNGRPFLLWLAWGPPHNPYETAPTNYRAMYSPDRIKLHPNVPAAAQDTARKELAGYYAHCTALDDCFNDLLRTLDQTGLSTNTIVVFTSDHGDMLWSQNQQRKQRPWEESARVPMLFRLPASFRIQARRLNAMINTEDVMPTLLGLCGLAIPASVEGFDFTGVMRGGADPSGGATIVRCVAPFGEFIRSGGGCEYRALRTAQYTFVRDLKGPWLLFDNVAELQAKLDARLSNQLAAQRDEFRPGTDYIKKWRYRVDATETVPYKP
jgi:arylsulfatase A-like enzyme